MRSLQLFHKEIKGQIIHNQIPYFKKLKFPMKILSKKKFYKIKYHSFLLTKKNYNFQIPFIENINIIIKTNSRLLVKKNKKYFKNANNDKLVKFFSLANKKMLKEKKTVTFQYFVLTFLIFSIFIKVKLDTILFISIYYLYYESFYKSLIKQKWHINTKDSWFDHLIDTYDPIINKSLKEYMLKKEFNVYLLLKNKPIKEKNIRNNIFKNLIQIEFYKINHMSRKHLFDIALIPNCKGRSSDNYLYFFIKKLFVSINRNIIKDQYITKRTNDKFLNNKKITISGINIVKKNILNIYIDSKNYSYNKKKVLYHNIFIKISEYLLNYIVLNSTYHDKISRYDMNNMYLKFSKKLFSVYGSSTSLSAKLKDLIFRFKENSSDRLSSNNFPEIYVLNHVDKLIYHNKSIKVRCFFGIIFLNHEKKYEKTNFEKIINYPVRYKVYTVTINYSDLLKSFIKNYGIKNSSLDKIQPVFEVDKILYSFIPEPEINPSNFKIKTNRKRKNTTTKNLSTFIKLNRSLIEKKITRTYDQLIKKIIQYNTKTTENIYDFKFHHICNDNYKKKTTLDIKFKIVELWKLNANLNHLSGVNEGLMYFSKQLFIKNSKKFLRLVQSFKLFLHIKLKMRKKIKTTEFNFKILKKFLMQKGNTKFNDDDFVNKLVSIKNLDDHYRYLMSEQENLNTKLLRKNEKAKVFVINFKNKKVNEKTNYALQKHNKFERFGIDSSDVVFFLQNSYFYNIEQKFYKINKFKLNINNFEKFIIIFFATIKNDVMHNCSDYQTFYEKIFFNIKIDKFFSEIQTNLIKKNIGISNSIETRIIKTNENFIKSRLLYMLINEKFSIYCLKNKIQSSTLKNYGLDFLSDVFNFTKMNFLKYINNSFYPNFFFNSEKNLSLNDLLQSNQNISNYESIYINLILGFGSRFLLKCYPVKRKNILFKIKNLKIFNFMMILQKNFIANLGIIKSYNNHDFINSSIFLIEKIFQNLKITKFNKYYYKKSMILNYSFNNLYKWVSFTSSYYFFNVHYINDKLIIKEDMKNELDKKLLYNYVVFNMQKALAHTLFYGKGVIYGKIKMSIFDICINKIKSSDN